MTEEKYDLDRETNLKSKIDSTFKKWEIKSQRGRALYFARPNPDREDAVIPKNMQGLWTKVELLNAEIDKYVKASWEQADKADQKAERKRIVAKAASKKNDSGKTDNKELLSA